jgi:hypothetical protein
MQLMRHDMDDNAVCIDTGIKPRAVKWNHNGSVSNHHAGTQQQLAMLTEDMLACAA